jgi:hypothetical protein
MEVAAAEDYTTEMTFPFLVIKTNYGNGDINKLSFDFLRINIQ